MTYRSACMLFLLLCATLSFQHTSGAADDGAEAGGKVETLKAELAKAEADLTKAQADLAQRSQAILQKQHEIEYGDPETKALKESVVALEKELIAKRKELQLRIALNPELKALEQERVDLFRNLEGLRQTHQAILNELKALEAGAGATP